MGRVYEKKTVNGRTGGASLFLETPFITLVLSLAAAALFAVPDLTGWLQFDRSAVARGEFWRFFTGHLTHWSSEHLLWDLTVFFALGLMCEKGSRLQLLTVLAVSVPLVSFAVWVFLPNLQYYRGLSGMDAALFMLLAGQAAVDFTGRGRRKSAAMIMAAAGACLFAKVSYEFLSGLNVFVKAGGTFQPVPLAHVVGGAVGAAVPWAAHGSRRLSGSAGRARSAPLSP